MSYGSQLNIFDAKAQQYGSDWRGIIICDNRTQLDMARRDATERLGGNYSGAAQALTLPNGASLLFRVVQYRIEAERAFRGREFTQIAWLFRPTGDHGEYNISLARAHLRSRTVPNSDLRYEYCMVR
jgi:hypothetical protein